jgi:hypothetical protein
MNEAIYSGSEVKIKYTIKPWFVDSMGLGVSLRPQAVQCIELVSSVGGNIGEDFETVPGGYVAEASRPSPAIAMADTSMDFVDEDSI